MLQLGPNLYLNRNKTVLVGTVWAYAVSIASIPAPACCWDLSQFHDIIFLTKTIKGEKQLDPLLKWLPEQDKKGTGRSRKQIKRRVYTQALRKHLLHLLATHLGEHFQKWLQSISLWEQLG